MNMVAVGMKVPEIALMPPDIKTVHDVLSMMDVAFKMNVRGPDVGEYVYKKRGERSATMTARNSYPSDFDYGLIYAFVKRFRPPDSRELTVRRDDTIPNRKSGADSCIYHIKW